MCVCVCVCVSLRPSARKAWPVASSPSGSLLRYPQAVQVGLLPTAAPLLGRVDVAREEGPRGVAVGVGPVAVLLRVPLVDQVVGVFKGAVLMSGCRRGEKPVLTTDLDKVT